MRSVIGILVLVLFVAEADVIFAQVRCAGNQIFSVKSCAGDENSADEQALFQIVNKYRSANGRPEIRLSQQLSIVANRHLLDLNQNLNALTHSWSNCAYDIKDEKTWPCVSGAPARLGTGYKGQGYETLYRTATGIAKPNLAIDEWRKNTLHNSIILNLGMFKDRAWDEVGVAIDEGYAALWFGYPGAGPKAVGDNSLGLGVSYDQAVAGLSKILSINETSSAAKDNKWQGYSADKKIKLEIYGTREEISEAKLGIALNMEPSGKLSQQNHLVIETLLKNLFPEWPDRAVWLEKSVAAVSLDQSASRTKLVRKIAIELRSDGPNSLTLLVRPQSRQSRFVSFE